MKRLIALALIFILLPNATFSQDGFPKPFSNAAFMYGTNLGCYMQTLYKVGKYDDMVKFTARETIKEYGEKRVKQYYQDCQFAYEIKLVSAINEGAYRILTYNAKTYATNRVVRIKTTVENDTAKVVLKNLKIEFAE